LNLSAISRLFNNSFIQNKCKDDIPANTISKIRDILRQIPIFPVIEEKWGAIFDEIWWVHLCHPQSGIFTNGKGLSPDFALASAYGEFIERLQNQVFFLIKDWDFDGALFNEFHFYFSPDEKYIALKDLFAQFPQALRDVFSYDTNIDNSYLYYFANETPPMLRSKGDFVAIPFYNLFDDNVIYLPLPFLKYYYGTNGMCAGNTSQEAITQGICEILERYVIIRETLFRNLSYPTVPNKYLVKCGKLYEIIEKIKSIDGYELVVKDCLPITNLPVLCVILIDRKNKKYFVKFGAHPVFAIALERCLTELLQGRIFNNFPLISLEDSIISNKNEIQSEKNVLEIFQTGSGIYPISLFFEVPNNYYFSWKSFSSNDEILKYLFSILRDLNTKILIRDVSFLNFPSYYIVIPKISEYFYWNKEDCIRIGKKKTIRSFMRSLHECSEQMIEDILKFTEEGYGSDKTIDSLLGLPVKNTFPLTKVTYDQFLAAAYYHQRDIKKSYQYIKRFLKSLSNVKQVNDNILQYYQCARDYLAILLNGNNKGESLEVLKYIHSEDMLQEILDDFSDPDKIFKYYPKLSCWKCNNCEKKKHCYYPGMSEILRRLRKCLQTKLPVQQELKMVLRKYI